MEIQKVFQDNLGKKPEGLRFLWSFGGEYMSDYLIELAEALTRHMPNKDIDYWMELITHDRKIEQMARRFLEEDEKREMD